tara:strand:+ start:2665 stop:3279 length:615 start_codon:yes stop_codon:yes gene_type:complete
MDKIGLIDTGLSNFGSWRNILLRFDRKAEIISESNQLSNYTKIILPGVGKFDSAMRFLNKNKFSEDLISFIKNENIIILGVCLGMQLLCKKSEEGELPGLGLIDANVKHLGNINNQKLRYPHMGWNKISANRDNPLIPKGQDYKFYFVHSYYVELNDDSLQIAQCSYVNNFCAAFNNNNIYGVQFHPERSHRYGLNLIERFINI